MKQSVLIFVTLASALIGAGCSPQASEAAVVGSTPAVGVPIGPIPGPATAAPSPPNPYRDNAVAATEGRNLFVHYNCYGCHGGHGGGGMGPSLRDADWMYGDSDAHIFSSISEGRAHGMPAWGTQLPQEQIWKLVAYIKTMGSKSEPSPPPPFPARPPSVQAALR